MQRVLVVIEPVAELMALEPCPQSLDRIQFRRIRWQWKQRDVLWNFEAIARVPSCVVHHKHDVHAGIDVLADPAQMHVHAVGVDGWRDHAYRVTRQRVDRAEDVHPLVLALLGPNRPRSPRCPDLGQRSLLTESRFVLEPDLDALLGMLILDITDKRGASRTQRSAASGS